MKRRAMAGVALLLLACGDDAPAATSDAGATMHELKDATPAPPPKDATPPPPPPMPKDAGARDSGARDAAAADGGGWECPASGEPAVDSCPCQRPAGEYCCGVGSGMICTKEHVWVPFFDSPCAPESDGGPFGAPMIQCSQRPAQR